MGTKPVISQAMTPRRIHRRDKFEGVQRLPTGIHLFEDKAYGFMRRVVTERYHGDLVTLEILKNFIPEPLK